MNLPKLADFSHTIELAARWGDMDAMGHVNNAKFFTYDESVRLDYFQKLMHGDARFWKDYGLILAHIEADFIAQLRCPATLTIGMRIARMGRSSLNTLAGMFKDGELVAVTRGVVVWFDYPAGKTLPLPADVRARIKLMERLAPEE